ncbi:MAG: iron-containing redox enzyme family protein [Actinomycetota bacterium]|nr:iron-containing redox enzyme family protein [Actinomycetota bacterium]
MGPVTEGLFALLRGDASEISPISPSADPLGDLDLQLALYAANELHYGGVQGVDDELEWDPAVSSLRRQLEDAMLEQLRAECAPVEAGSPDDVPGLIFDLIERDDSPPLARYLETQADLEQFREFVIHRSAYQLKEADPHTFTIPRISGPAKAAMVEIQADEYGGGVADRMHSALFAKTMSRLGLDPTPNSYVDRLPASSLAPVNVITLFTMRRSLRGALVGHLAGFEITSSVPNRRYANGLRRLGQDAEATEFYDEHVEADSVHENIAAFDLARGLARQEPDLAGEILFGVSALLATEARFADQILASFRAERTSLVEASELAVSAR